jgi:hypothetical protein
MTTANHAEERQALKLMKGVNLVNAHVPASSQTKLVMCNQIHGLMVEKSLPSFFLPLILL